MTKSRSDGEYLYDAAPTLCVVMADGYACGCGLQARAVRSIR